MLTLADLSAPKSFLISILFSLTAYFILRSAGKRKKKDNILVVFWILGALYFLSIGASALSFYFIPWLGLRLSYVCLFFVGIQFFIGIFYLITRIVVKPRAQHIIGIILGVAFAIALAFVFLTTKTTTRYDEPVFSVTQNVPQGYLGALIALGIVVFSLLLFRRDFKKGIISWDSMSEFYKLYGFIIYMTISLVRVLYFLPHPWYLEIFYFVIPYLAYKDYKEAK